MTNYKQKFTHEERYREGSRITQKYPDRVPIILEKNASADSIPDIDKHKFLVPRDLTVGQFIYVIRKRIDISAEKGLFIFINGIIPPTNALVGDIYNKHTDPDMFLYITYCGENAFG
jgi:GABA(A) receptor-associated protein